MTLPELQRSSADIKAELIRSGAVAKPTSSGGVVYEYSTPGFGGKPVLVARAEFDAEGDIRSYDQYRRFNIDESGPGGAPVQVGENVQLARSIQYDEQGRPLSSVDYGFNSRGSVERVAKQAYNPEDYTVISSTKERMGELAQAPKSPSQYLAPKQTRVTTGSGTTVVMTSRDTGTSVSQKFAPSSIISQRDLQSLSDRSYAQDVVVQQQKWEKIAERDQQAETAMFARGYPEGTFTTSAGRKLSSREIMEAQRLSPSGQQAEYGKVIFQTEQSFLPSGGSGEGMTYGGMSARIITNQGQPTIVTSEEKLYATVTDIETGQVTSLKPTTGGYIPTKLPKAGGYTAIPYVDYQPITAGAAGDTFWSLYKKNKPQINEYIKNFPRDWLSLKATPIGTYPIPGMKAREKLRAGMQGTTNFLATGATGIATEIRYTAAITSETKMPFISSITKPFAKGIGKIESDIEQVQEKRIAIEEKYPALKEKSQKGFVTGMQIFQEKQPFVIETQKGPYSVDISKTSYKEVLSDPKVMLGNTMLITAATGLAAPEALATSRAFYATKTGKEVLTFTDVIPAGVRFTVGGAATIPAGKFAGKTYLNVITTGDEKRLVEKYGESTFKELQTTGLQAQKSSAIGIPEKILLGVVPGSTAYAKYVLPTAGERAEESYRQAIYAKAKEKGFTEEETNLALSYLQKGKTVYANVEIGQALAINTMSELYGRATIGKAFASRAGEKVLVRKSEAEIANIVRWPLAKAGAGEGFFIELGQQQFRGEKTASLGGVTNLALAAGLGAGSAVLIGTPIAKYSITKPGKSKFIETAAYFMDPLEKPGDVSATGVQKAIESITGRPGINPTLKVITVVPTETFTLTEGKTSESIIPQAGVSQPKKSPFKSESKISIKETDMVEFIDSQTQMRESPQAKARARSYMGVAKKPRTGNFVQTFLGSKTQTQTQTPVTTQTDTSTQTSTQTSTNTNTNTMTNTNTNTNSFVKTNTNTNINTMTDTNILTNIYVNTNVAVPRVPIIGLPGGSGGGRRGGMGSGWFGKKYRPSRTLVGRELGIKEVAMGEVTGFETVRVGKNFKYNPFNTNVKLKSQKINKKRYKSQMVQAQAVKSILGKGPKFKKKYSII